MITRPIYTQQRPIVSSMFTEPVTLVRVNVTRNEHGEVTVERCKIQSKCSTNPISADDERVGQLQESGVRLIGLREFFTVEPHKVDVESKDEFIWQNQQYVGVQTADWGYYQSTIAALKEEQDGYASDIDSIPNCT